MANTTKKKSNTSRSTKSNKRKAPPAPKRPPIHRTARLVGGAICALMALCVLVSYFQTSALILNILSIGVKGLIGYGYYMTAVVLAYIGYIQLTSKDTPVITRTVFAALMPLLLGCILHLCLSKGVDEGTGLLKSLWMQGLNNQSGGVIAGGIAMGFKAVFGKAITLILFIVLFVVGIFLAIRMSPKQIAEKARESAAARRAYYAEDEDGVYMEEPVPVAKPIRKEASNRRVIDIPLNDEPLGGVAVENTLQTEEREGFFTKKSKAVVTPDELVSSQPPVQSTPQPAVQPAPIPVAPPVAEAMKPIDEPVAPAEEKVVTRRTVKHIPEEELQAAEEEIANEIEKKEQEAPKTAYQFPPLSLLQPNRSNNALEAGAELRNNSKKLADTLLSFGVDATPGEVIHGPSVTRYEFTLRQGVKLSKITNLSDDIALALGASGVRIAPVPNKESAVGIEVPNRATSAVRIREVVDSHEFRAHSSNTAFAIGKDIGGNSIVGDIGKLPHVLIAGTTGSGKSVCTNSLIISLMYKSSPDDVRFIMVDPKMVELAPYNGIPHLLIPVVTDPKKAAGALQWAVFEMMKRYKIFSENGIKDLKSFNELAEKEKLKPEEERNAALQHMPSVVVVIDELADLMLVAAKEVEESICRVAQMGRAAGVHLVIATQRPSADVITGLMKANIPSRIAFAVASSMESRIILDTTGAEKLIGKGDMLYFPVGMAKPLRVQGCFITAEEIEEVVAFVKQSGEANYDQSVMDQIEKVTNKEEKGKNAPAASEASADDCDELLPAAVDIILETGQASVSMLQRRLKLGYARAARLVDQMEERGIVGPFEGSKPRQLLISKAQWQEMQMKGSMNANEEPESEISRYGTIADQFESHDALE